MLSLGETSTQDAARELGGEGSGGTRSPGGGELLEGDCDGGRVACCTFHVSTPNNAAPTQTYTDGSACNMNKVVQGKQPFNRHAVHGQ